jgi:hypothetical protein
MYIFFQNKFFQLEKLRKEMESDYEQEMKALSTIPRTFDPSRYTSSYVRPSFSVSSSDDEAGGLEELF